MFIDPLDNIAACDVNVFLILFVGTVTANRNTKIDLRKTHETPAKYLDAILQ